MVVVQLSPSSCPRYVTSLVMSTRARASPNKSWWWGWVINFGKTPPLWRQRRNCNTALTVAFQYLNSERKKFVLKAFLFAIHAGKNEQIQKKILKILRQWRQSKHKIPKSESFILVNTTVWQKKIVHCSCTFEISSEKLVPSIRISRVIEAAWLTFRLAGEAPRPRRPVIFYKWTPTKWIFLGNY